MTRAHFRRDIQGLRAVAVVLVIFNHLLKWPSGGFIGVDVFFVISGFLITSHLLREHEREGRISLVGFYRRRVKRLAPVALLVVAVTLVVAHALFTPVRFASVWTDAVWAVLFGENWRQIAVGTDYMHAGTAISPFQHYWSLSVEEQFYFIWPLLLVAVFAIGAVRRTRRRAGVVLVLITVVSLAWGYAETAHQPTWAYFSLFSRAWELGAGAVLACAAPLAARLPLVARVVLAWVGLAAIAGSALLLTAESAFPVPGAIPAVVGAVLVIGAGSAAPARYFWPVTSRPANYIGTISYSLYLWHFPVVVFWAAVFPATSRKYLLPALLLTAVLAVISYHWIENPFRQRSWAHPLRTTGERARPRTWIALAALLALVVAIPSASVAVRRPAAGVSAVPIADIMRNAMQSDAATERTARISAALSAKSWPRLTPTLDVLDANYKAPEWVRDGCLGDDQGSKPDPITNARRCVYGNPHGTNTLDIFGDSTAISYAPAIRAALPSSWRIEVWTLKQCPAVDVTTRLGDVVACAAFRSAFFAHVARTHPAVVAVSSTTEAIQNLASNAAGAQAEAEWQGGTQKLLSAVAPHAGTVLMLDPPPLGPPLDQCGLALSTPADCVSGVGSYYVSQAQAQLRAVDAFNDAHVVYPATVTWFCNSDGFCPAFVNGVTTLDDGVHLTAAASKALAPLMRAALAPALAAH